MTQLPEAKTDRVDIMHSITRSPYSLLLGVLISIWIVYGVLPLDIALPITWVLSLLMIFITFKTLMMSKRLFRTYIFIATTSLVADLIYITLLRGQGASNTINLILSLIFSSFIFLSIVLMVKNIFSSQEVTGDKVIGGICIFMMLGTLWYLVYYSIYSIDPKAFSGPTETLTEFDFIYFSFTTLTTVGYGEYVPVSRVAKVAANFEAIVGVLYPATLIATLVNSYNVKELYSTTRNNSDL